MTVEVETVPEVECPECGWVQRGAPSGEWLLCGMCSLMGVATFHRVEGSASRLGVQWRLP